MLKMPAGNGNYIEPAGRILRASCPEKVVEGRVGDLLLFMKRHRLERVAGIPVAPILYFRKYKGISVPRDQVDLTVPVPEIARKNAIPLFQKVLLGCFFKNASDLPFIQWDL